MEVRVDMGSSVGYRVRHGSEISPVFRKEWMEQPINVIVDKTWQALRGSPDYGITAIRSDLDIGRTFAALIFAAYSPPFDSIRQDTACDISVHGLFEIDISQFDRWIVYELEVTEPDDTRSGTRKKVATMDRQGFRWTEAADKSGH